MASSYTHFRFLRSVSCVSSGREGSLLADGFRRGPVRREKLHTPRVSCIFSRIRVAFWVSVCRTVTAVSGRARRSRLARRTADGELLEQNKSPSHPPLPLRPSLSVPRTDFSRRPLPSAVPPSRTTSLPPSLASVFHPLPFLRMYFLYKTALCVSSRHR